ncbi:MAG: HAMP domain-containing histidine kinase [Dechloromonas sp.]|nr:MAG: HAMP domain-containing histidine kinase [Dechloromonas sp.]
MRPYDSLREKLVQPFVLFGYVVSATLSLTTFALLAHIEERAIARTLQVELEAFRNRHALNPQARPAESGVLRGTFLPAPGIRIPAGFSTGMEVLDIRNIDDVDYSVLFADVGGRGFALLYDRSYIKSNLADLAFLLLIATGAMTLLTFLVANRLSRRVIQPIVKLIDEVSAKADLRGLPGERVAFDDTAYPADEIGALVKALDRYSNRLQDFALREGYFAADVSHELLTPLAVITGAVEVMSELPELSEPVRRRLATVYRNAGRMTQILEAMLLLAREESPYADPSCNLAEVIAEAVADCMPSLEGRPVVIAIRELEPVTLPVERSLVYVLVSNLLRNACAHTREGSIDVSLQATGLKVADTGIGVPEPRLNEMFRRHAKSQESAGHGLGLSIVARICERLRWEIAVESAPGKGTTFSFRFLNLPD